MNLNNISRPVLVLDEFRCRRNIERMVQKAKKAGCVFRPHFKTHQSQTVGRWFREKGVKGITVSSPSMAAYFARDSWDDITIAFPFHPAQLKDLQALEQKCKLRLFIHSVDHLGLLNSHLKLPFDVVIEIDAGYGRSGISPGEQTLISDLVSRANRLGKSNFHGFYIHDGRTYHTHGKDEILAAVSSDLETLKTLKQKYPEARISLGDTPSASVSENLDLLDEITPGNFVFYDWMQTEIGSCSPDDVGLFVLLPVAQTYPDRIILHGGAVHLSKDFLPAANGQKNYGQLIDYAENNSISPVRDTFLSALSQEHGTLTGPGLPEAENAVWMCPIHSCLTANLYDHYITTKGERIEKRVLS